VSRTAESLRRGTKVNWSLELEIDLERVRNQYLEPHRHCHACVLASEGSQLKAPFNIGAGNEPCSYLLSLQVCISAFVQEACPTSKHSALVLLVNAQQRVAHFLCLPQRPPSCLSTLSGPAWLK